MEEKLVTGPNEQTAAERWGWNEADEISAEWVESG
jgi:hypothetical protein